LIGNKKENETKRQEYSVILPTTSLQRMPSSTRNKSNKWELEDAMLKNNKESHQNACPQIHATRLQPPFFSTGL